MRMESLSKFSFWKVLFLESEAGFAAQIFILERLFLESKAGGAAHGMVSKLHPILFPMPENIF